MLSVEYIKFSKLYWMSPCIAQSGNPLSAESRIAGFPYLKIANCELRTAKANPKGKNQGEAIAKTKGNQEAKSPRTGSKSGS